MPAGAAHRRAVRPVPARADGRGPGGARDVVTHARPPRPRPRSWTILPPPGRLRQGPRSTSDGTLVRTAAAPPRSPHRGPDDRPPAAGRRTPAHRPRTTRLDRAPVAELRRTGAHRALGAGRAAGPARELPLLDRSGRLPDKRVRPARRAEREDERGLRGRRHRRGVRGGVERPRPRLRARGHPRPRPHPALGERAPALGLRFADPDDRHRADGDQRARRSRFLASARLPRAAAGERRLPAGRSVALVSASRG